MADTTVTEIHEKLEALLAAGKEAEAQAYLLEHLDALPESVRAEIMLDLFADGLEKHVGEIEDRAAIARDVIAAADALEARAQNDS